VTAAQDHQEPKRSDDQNDLERTLEDVSLPEAVPGFSKSRVELVARAAREWARALIDLGGRNNLLRYRELRAGTLDLTDASPVAIEALLASKPVRTSALFPDPEERAQQLKRVRTIHNKAKENFEERGVETLSLGCGLATWENERSTGWTPCAPVLLRQATLRALGAAQDEFELELLDEMEVNPTLLHLLKVDFNCDLPQESLLERVDGVIDELWELEETYQWLAEHTSRVPGFSIEPRLVLTNFAYAKLPMVRDIEGSFEQLVGHELIAAIAGDEEARQTIRDRGPGPDAVPSPDSIALADEFIVLDADSSQNYAINAVLGRTSLIVRGPPGTGKSQTISNLIASLVAREKKVLFVAEKRAAIDAVLKRLTDKKLDELVLDLHGGAGSRRAFAERIGKALLATRSVPRVDGSAQRQRVESNREELNAYVKALHERREPWGLSVFEMRAELIGLGEIGSELRLTAAQLEKLDADAIDKAENDLRDFVRRGGLSLPSSNSPWRNAVFTSGEEAQIALETVEGLRRTTLPTALAALQQAAEETGLGAASTVAEWEPRLELWREVEATLADCAPGLYTLDLGALSARMAPAQRGGFSRLKASLTSSDYKAARAELQQQLNEGRKLGDCDLLARAEAAAAQQRRWRELGGRGEPSAPSAENLDELYAQLRGQFERVEALTAQSDLANVPLGDLERRLNELVADRATLQKLPELHRLEDALRALPLGALLDELTARAVNEATAVRELRDVWLLSILDSLAFTDLTLGAFDAAQHEATIEEYRAGDKEHIESTPARIRRLAAERFHAVRDAFPHQDQLLLAQAKLKRKHLPVREVVRRAEDVLLALKPCWAMSPLLVSQLLPAKTIFDVVIFDEASQITPADAIPSIVRGHQLVVAGDDRQLPPTSFFVSETPDELGEEEELSEEAASALALESAGLAGTSLFESILDALDVILRKRMLLWHYRSRDERLIAFSNAHIYDRQLVTFPGVGGERVLCYVEVPWKPGSDTNSPTAEVERVVELILEHARERPHESLGVIAMGIKHADRVDECLRQRLRDDKTLERELGGFFSESRDERFFVKNLERVQGDERDAIILSIGYGKNANGVLPLRFGPLLVEGGERRLNVAVTRAKSRITLVSSFKADDIDLTKTQAAGMHLLRQYLQYVESDAHNLGDLVLEKPPLNPFEVDVRDTLAKRGLNLLPQYGVSGYLIDFVAPHPGKPGRYVLAIECDGATYHSSESARDRDRLRQSQLENLGWTFHRIWSSEWFYNKERCVGRLLEAYKEAIERADQPTAAPAQTAREAANKDVGASADANLVAEEVRAAFGNGKNNGGNHNRRGKRPLVRKARPIEEHRLSALVDLARWIESGDEIYNEDEVVREMMNELGYRRLGHKIEARLRSAVRQARR
jgi:very-short-patch-repair endonuclease